MPDRSDLPYDNYFATGTGEPEKTALQHNSRGCEYKKCTFCSTPTTHPGQVRSNSAKRIVDETQHVIKHYGRDYIFYSDEHFSHNPQRVYEICNEIKARGLQGKFEWRIFARVDIEKGLLDVMKEAGLVTVFYGIESMNPETLRRLRKGTTPEMIEHGIKEARSRELGVIASLMMGYPWETENELTDSLNAFLALRERYNIKDFVYPTFLTPFPGTELYRYCREHNLIIESDFSQYHCNSQIIKTPIPPEKLLEIRDGFVEKVRLTD